jgi:uncharacterized protein YkwD
LTAVAEGLSSGSTPAQRVEYNGYDGSSAENQARILRIYTKGSQPIVFEPLADDTWLFIMQEWMKSTTGHCSNIMNASFEDFGMYEAGVYDEDNGTHILHATYWTQNFGKPQ